MGKPRRFLPEDPTGPPRSQKSRNFNGIRLVPISFPPHQNDCGHNHSGFGLTSPYTRQRPPLRCRRYFTLWFGLRVLVG